MPPIGGGGPIPRPAPSKGPVESQNGSVSEAGAHRRPAGGVRHLHQADRERGRQHRKTKRARTRARSVRIRSPSSRGARWIGVKATAWVDRDVQIAEQNAGRAGVKVHAADTDALQVQCTTSSMSIMPVPPTGGPGSMRATTVSVRPNTMFGSGTPSSGIGPKPRSPTAPPGGVRK